MKSNHSLRRPEPRRTKPLRRVVITGIGVVAPNGIGLVAFWDALANGKSGIAPIASFDAQKYRTRIAAEVKQFDPAKYMDSSKVEKVDRFAQLGIAAGKMALADAKLEIPAGKQNEIGLCIGSGLGGMFFYEKQMWVFAEDRDPSQIHPLSIARIMPSSVSGQMAIEFGLRGPNTTVSTACSSSAHAIGMSFDAIRFGRSDVMVTGGAEAPIMPLMFSGFDAMRVMSANNDNPEQASRPFDARRDGMVLGEGSAIFVIEELNHALKRGATIYGELIGYGATSGAYHMIIPDPSGNDVVKTMELALQDAEVDPEAIDFISAHGTATKLNDKIEAQAIKRVFGSHAKRLAISSAKSMVGHLLGAAGAIGMAAALLAFDKDILPPTINYQNPDTDCDLDFIANKARNAHVETAMVNAFGFGSNNAALIVRRYSE